MGFQNLFFSFLLSSRRKSAAAIAINVPVSSRKCDVFPFCNASADTEAADGFFGDYRLCLLCRCDCQSLHPVSDDRCEQVIAF